MRGCGDVPGRDFYRVPDAAHRPVRGFAVPAGRAVLQGGKRLPRDRFAEIDVEVAAALGEHFVGQVEHLDIGLVPSAVRIDERL